MKKPYHTAGNKSQIRSFLVVAGLVTAIIGSLVLLRDFYATGVVNTSMTSPIKVSKIIHADLLVNAASAVIEIGH